jgi:hypothetical protein
VDTGNAWNIPGAEALPAVTCAETALAVFLERKKDCQNWLTDMLRDSQWLKESNNALEVIGARFLCPPHLTARSPGRPDRPWNPRVWSRKELGNTVVPKSTRILSFPLSVIAGLRVS